MSNEEFLGSISEVGEIWKPIVGYEGIYAVSNLGRVASFERYVIGTGMKCMRYNAPRLMSPRKSKTYNGGYYTVSLKLNGLTKNEYVHRLVALHFVTQDDPNKKEVDHINCNTLDNRATNLRFVSHSENLRNPNTVKKQSESHKGNTNAPRKAVVRIIGDSVKYYDSMSSANKDGYHHAAIHRCCNGLQNEHKGARWMYLSDYETSKSAMSKNSMELGEG